MLSEDFEPAVTVPLEPVDSVELVSLIDNVTDVFMPDQGPAKRVGLRIGATRPATLMAEGWTPDALVAEHGFAMLVTVVKGGRSRRLLFDTGTSPDGVVENMRRLDVDPGSIEAIVCSHGHFDHTTGLDGLSRVARPGRPAGADPPALLASPPDRVAWLGSARDPHHQPPGARPTSASRSSRSDSPASCSTARS